MSENEDSLDVEDFSNIDMEHKLIMKSRQP